MKNQSYSVQTVVQGLKESLHQYLEAQYHIWDESLIRERLRLIEEIGCTYQIPYLESIPVYKQGVEYANLNIPQASSRLLANISAFNAGIYPKPFAHQSRALESFLGDKKDIVVATGTGSGKTESFLMPILGSLAIEAAERPLTAQKHGARALLLYPMNALVNDQVARLRRLLGHERVAEELKKGRGRYVTFGMYTGRTPYPGLKETQKDNQRLLPLFKSFYRNPKESVKKELLREGKWPAKDMQAFEENRYRTLPSDKELFTRHEMQETCPDILVTNYSMLEYMLLRPIERSIFEQTREWLASDPANEFIVVLDEAHIYRGAAGAEVALLLRRLRARLGISRERMRFILTSASLGSTDDAKQKGLKFAADLTGQEGGNRKFELITGERAALAAAAAGTPAQAHHLAAFKLANFHQMHEDFDRAKAEVNDLLRKLELPDCSSADNYEALQDILYRRLDAFPPASELISLISGQAVSFQNVADALFPGTGDAGSATEALLALATFASRAEDKRVFAPVRLHLFYRGLPGIYVCVNPECNSRRDKDSSKTILGKMFNKSRTHCDCGGRVYELLTHRDCGVSFIRGYLRNATGDFLWHEPSHADGSHEPFVEAHFLVESDRAHSGAEGYENWLHIETGRIVTRKPDGPGYLPVYRPNGLITVNDRKLLTFDECPVCLGTWAKNTTKIMDLATKGEAPFAHLVKSQVMLQPPTRKKSERFPNAGRKSLLFSDGRQKAARLARDIPREVEQDTFRQVLMLAINELLKNGREPKPDKNLYLACLFVLKQFSLYLFDGDDKEILIKDIKNFDRYGDDLAEVIEEWQSPIVPAQFHQHLVRQLGNTFYSVSALTLAYVCPSKRTLRAIKGELPHISEDELLPLAVAWIQSMLDRFAFDEHLPSGVRSKAAGYNAIWGGKGKFKKDIRPKIDERYGSAESIEKVFCSHMATNSNGLWFLEPGKLQFHMAVNEQWQQCQQCTFLSPMTLHGGLCANCGHPQVSNLDPNMSDYLRARKRFWRDPVVSLLSREGEPFNLNVEEHTAQLSFRDYDDIYATTEEFELNFRDILIEDRALPVDVLSCTTTMEVGVDIGSLVAVGLRNIPPERQNYQQRAGRAGRRGASVSTVVTYAQNSPHDSYYFSNPPLIIAGEPPLPSVDVRNERIVERHINVYLLQSFFHQQARNVTPQNSKDVFTALGETWLFYTDNQDFSLASFSAWLSSGEAKEAIESIKDWLPSGMNCNVTEVAQKFVKKIEDAKPVSKDHLVGQTVYLIEYLFNKGLLPSYAFPRDLCALQIERLEYDNHQRRHRVRIIEKPQQSMNVALSEYAPGRTVVVNKKTYRIGAVSASLPSTVQDRARPLFDEKKQYIHCPECHYVQGYLPDPAASSDCPLCHTKLEAADMIQPEVVFPEGKGELDELDNDQVFSEVTSAQLPVPAQDDDFKLLRFGVRGSFIHAPNQSLVMVNKGDKETTEGTGFEVCQLCGHTVFPEKVRSGGHVRHYETISANGMRVTETCKGDYQRVYLGYEFKSDILLFRISLDKPLLLDLGDPAKRKPLEDAVMSLAQALALAACRKLQIDQRELNSGYRFLKIQQQLYADIFIYDTLSGGAGYADLAGQEFAEIFELARTLLSKCSCDSSCHDCLRHYGNRFSHGDMDRFLALDLMRYIETGETPEIRNIKEQARELRGLKAMLELEGWQCTDGVGSAMLAHNDGSQIELGTYPALVDPEAARHPGYGKAVLFSSYELEKNLPGAFQKVSKK